MNSKDNPFDDQHVDQTVLNIKNIDISGITHLGLVKKENEDRYLAKQMDDQALLLSVADGLGGGVSSDIAAELIKTRLAQLKYLTNGKEQEELAAFAQELDQVISFEIEKKPELEGMAATLVCVVLKNDIIHWLNVGDSRFYILRNRELIQVSTDQTLAKFLVEEGEITKEEAKNHYSKDVLDQCVGYGECFPETNTFYVQKNDLLILATDGLYKMVSKQDMLPVLNQKTSVEEKTKALLKAALDSGGKDNITIIVAKINKLLR